MRWLKVSTSADVPIGPFVDSTDGFTAKTGLSITQPDIRLKKNAAAWAQKNAAQTLTHEENGYYEVTLDATDTNTLGLLRLAVVKSTALPVWEDFLVVPAKVYDTLITGSSGISADLQYVNTAVVSTTTAQLGVNVVQAAGTAWNSGAIVAATIATNAIDADALATDAITEIQSGLATASALATVQADTDDIQSKIGTPTNLAGGGATLAGNLADIEGQTNDIGVAGAGLTALGDTRLANLDAAITTRLAPTVTGRTLDVTATGGAGIDWANVENQSTAVNLSATNIDVDQVVASVTAGVTVTTNNDKTGYDLSSTQTFNNTGSWTGNIIGSLTGAVSGSVGGSVQLVRGNVNGNVMGDLVGSVLTDVQGSVQGSVNSVSTAVTVGTNNDKTGYQLSAVGVDDIWDEPTAGHVTAGTTGKALIDAGSAGDPWGTTVPGAYGAGTAGYILGTNLNSTVSSRATQTSVDAVSGFVDTEVAAIKAKTDNLPSSFPTNFGLLGINGSGHISRVTLTDTLTTNSDKTGYSLSASQTFNNTGTWTGNIAGSLLGAVSGSVAGNILGSVNSVVSGVAVNINNDKTGYRLSAVGVDDVWDEVLSGHTTAGTAGKALSDAATVADPWAISVPGAYGAGTAGYVLGTNLNSTVSSRATQTSVDAVSGFVDTEVAAIKAKTDNLPASFPSNFGSLLINGSGHISRVTLVDTTTLNSDMVSAATVAGSVWVRVAEGSYTVMDLLKIIAAVSGGKSSGEPTSIVFRNVADTKDRVSGTVDGSGNRTAVTYDLT